MVARYPENIFYTILKSALPLLFLFFATALFSQTYNAELLNYESSYMVDGNVLNISCSVSIKINNAQGDEYAKVVIPYLEENELDGLDAWIEDGNGKKIRKLKKKEIADVSNVEIINLFDDNRAKVFELKYNVYPYIIKYNYTFKKKEFNTICDWSPVNSKIPTLATKLTIDIPADYKISFYENKISPPVKDSTKKRITLTWQGEYKQPIKPEIYSPSFRELTPRVLVVPVDFNFGISGNQHDWASFGNWYYNLNKGLDDLPQTEVDKVNELIKGTTDKKLIVKRLYEYLQDNTRYVSVQVGIGGYKSSPADFVADKKYGDCKALSNYMKALLKAAGIPSSVALVNAGNGEHLYKMMDKFVASQFNHVILMVPLERDSIWLDCTSKSNPAGYLGTFTQNRYALIINENNCRLVKTPALVLTNCYTFCKNSMSIDTTGNAFLTSCTISKGSGFDINASYAQGFSKEKQKEYLYAIVPYQNFEVKRLNIKTESRDSSDIELDYQIILKNNVTQSGNYMFIRLSEPKLPEFENPSKRHLPLRLACPINYMDSTEITVPAKYTAEKIQDENSETPYGAVKIKYILKDNKIEVYRNILVRAGEYTTKEYPDFYRFITKLHEAVNTPLSFKKNE